jgi:23S rRNA (guanosine2251-2'-O)-methyltransferase
MNLICGINPVLEALAAGTRHFDRLLVVKGLRNRRLAEAIRRATRLGIPLRFELRDTLDRLAGGVPHQGVIAIVSARPTLSLEQLVDAAREPALLVALDGVEDPRNLGAVLRTVEAAGADGVLTPERHSAGLSEIVARASAGALEHVQVARVGNLVQALEGLKDRGIWAVGLDASGSERWDAVDLCRPVVLVFGGEGRGIRRLVREHCDHLVCIPQFGHVSSLNVSVAVGIALYEAVRQRRAVPSTVKPIPARPVLPVSVIGPEPDDGETDPGAPPRPVTDAEPVADEEGEVEPALARVDIHGDEVAWGGGPTVLKPLEFRRGRRPLLRRHRGGPMRPSGPVGEGASPGGSEPRPAGREDAPGPRRGRRRRRRRRHDGSGAPSGDPSASSPRGPAEAPPPAPDGPAEGGAARGKRRAKGRRRRRRR